MNKQQALEICKKYYPKYIGWLKVKSFSGDSNTWVELNAVHKFLYNWEQPVGCPSCQSRKALLENVYRWAKPLIEAKEVLQEESKPIEKHSYEELLKIARDKGLKVRHNMGKDKLIKLIKDGNN